MEYGDLFQLSKRYNLKRRYTGEIRLQSNFRLADISAESGERVNEQFVKTANILKTVPDSHTVTINFR